MTKEDLSPTKSNYIFIDNDGNEKERVIFYKGSCKNKNFFSMCDG